MKDIYKNIPGGFSPHDGTIDFYLRIRAYVNKNTNVLDLGAGKGDWFLNKKGSKTTKSIQYLKPDVKKIVGADVDKIVLKNKSTHKNIIIKKKIPYKKNSFDLIICDWVFEHIEDPIAFYNEINRVLKKGGILCARTPYKYSYLAIISNLLDGSKFKSFILKKSQPGRTKYFKSFYRINTKNKINKIFLNYANNIFIYTPDPSYFFSSKIIFYVLKKIHFLLPSFFAGVLYAFLQKKN